MRLRRNPCPRAGRHPGRDRRPASLLTDQESAILVVILIVVTLLPWLADPLVRRARRLPWLPARLAGGTAGTGPGWLARLVVAGLAGVVALLVASPQIAAMVAQSHAGGATFPAGAVDTDYALSGANLRRAVRGLPARDPAWPGLPAEPHPLRRAGPRRGAHVRPRAERAGGCSG